MDDIFYMKAALKEAEYAFEEGEVPVGAVVVFKDRIISRAHNQVETLNDSTAHAEMLALTGAMNYMGAKYLHNCVLYVTLEPCVMCVGAVNWSQVSKVVYGACDAKKGFSNYGNLLASNIDVVPGIMKEESEMLLKRFFRQRREDKGGV